MGIFDDEIQMIQSIENEIPIVIRRTIEKFGFVILDYITNKQLDQKGEDALGQKLKPKYSLGYARIRIKKGLQVDHVDTHFTGKFHASLQIETRENEFVISSTVDYDQYIIGKYGIEIIKVQQQYLEDFVEKYLRPALIKLIDDKFTKS